MKKFFVTVGLASVMAALPVMLTPFASATEKGNPRFLGIWEGVDATDGSAQQILISSGGDNGQFNIVWFETFWTVCDGRRAVLKGIGELDSNDKDNLIANIVIICFDPDEQVVEDILTFTLVDKALLLATSENGAFVDLPLYRVSERVKHGGRDE